MDYRIKYLRILRPDQSVLESGIDKGALALIGNSQVHKRQCQKQISDPANPGRLDHKRGQRQSTIDMRKVMDERERRNVDKP